MTKKPKIAITCSFKEESGSYAIPKHYVEVLAKNGAIPYIIPHLPDKELKAQEIIGDVDGLLLSGGTDFDPKWFKQEPRYKLSYIVPERDCLEIELVQEARKTGLPFLGICRGIQAINIAAGGDVYQDIEKQVESPLRHKQDAPIWHPTHQIEIETGSLLEKILGTNSLRVNSSHHQSVRNVVEGFTPTAVASDGVIEAIEANNGIFQLGVQWHPERMWKKHPVHEKLFARLVTEAA